MDTCTTTNHISVDNDQNCKCGYFCRATVQQDRKTLETLSSILHSASDPERCVEIAEGYIRNKLKMYAERDKDIA